MRFAATLLIPLGALALGAAKPADDAKKLEGTWAVVWREYDGQKSEDLNDVLVGQEYTVAIQGGVFEVTRDGYSVEGPLTLKVDGSKKPKAVDFVDKKGRLVYQGIYRIKGDRLTLCYGPAGQRPGKFASPKDSGVRLLVLKRPSAFWDQIELQKLQTKFEPLLQPHAGALSGRIPGHPFTIMKHLAFWEVQQSERHMADALGRLQADLLTCVKTSGAEVHGDIRETKEKGLLRRFEFDYQQGKTEGQVCGEIKPGQKEGRWDLECLVGEFLVRKKDLGGTPAAAADGPRQ
jgi:uncharacterized protein (TIGR03067 family)